MTFTFWLGSLLKSFLTLSHPIWSRCFLIPPPPPSSNLVTIFSLTILFIVTRVCYLPPRPFQSLPLTLMSHLREAVSRLTVSFCSSYASPFALLLEKVLVNDKITALCQTNMPTKHFIKHYKQQKWILKNC